MSLATDQHPDTGPRPGWGPSLPLARVPLMALLASSSFQGSGGGGLAGGRMAATPPPLREPSKDWWGSPNCACPRLALLPRAPSSALTPSSRKTAGQSTK